MTNAITTPVLRYRAAKKTLQAAQARFDLANVALNENIKSAAVRNEWSAAHDVLMLAEEEYHAAHDAAYPMPDIEITSSHVIVRKLGLANLLEAKRIVDEQHAAGNLEFTRVFRGEAKRIADVENAEILA
jgi:hypothetical protein